MHNDVKYMSTLYCMLTPPVAAIGFMGKVLPSDLTSMVL